MAKAAAKKPDPGRSLDDRLGEALRLMAAESNLDINKKIKWTALHERHRNEWITRASILRDLAGKLGFKIELSE